jgi:hypothetical protein
LLLALDDLLAVRLIRFNRDEPEAVESLSNLPQLVAERFQVLAERLAQRFEQRLLQ